MAVLDGRTWFGLDPEFHTVITMITIAASELDLVELGPRVGVAFCKEFSDWYYGESFRYARMLHPVEWKRGAASG